MYGSGTVHLAAPITPWQTLLSFGEHTAHFLPRIPTSKIYYLLVNGIQMFLISITFNDLLMWSSNPDCHGVWPALPAFRTCCPTRSCHSWHWSMMWMRHDKVKATCVTCFRAETKVRGTQDATKTQCKCFVNVSMQLASNFSDGRPNFEILWIEQESLSKMIASPPC